jgi:hypothetical protein
MVVNKIRVSDYIAEALSSIGVKYVYGIMGGGARYLVNDRKPDGEEACFSFSLDRNAGIKDIDI